MCGCELIDRLVLQPDERSRFEGVFQTLKPVGGLLTGEKVKPVMLASKLPVDALGKVTHTYLLTPRNCLLFHLLSHYWYLLQIWNLSDIDRDGKLDIDEFSVVRYCIHYTRLKVLVVRLLPQYNMCSSNMPPPLSRPCGSSRCARLEKFSPPPFPLPLSLHPRQLNRVGCSPLPPSLSSPLPLPHYLAAAAPRPHPPYLRLPSPPRRL